MTFDFKLYTWPCRYDTEYALIPTFGMTGRCPGGTQYKSAYRDVPQTWVAKSASWFINDPLLQFGIWMGRFFKMFSNLRKFEKNWSKIVPKSVIGRNGSLFLGKLVPVCGSTFKFPAACPYRNQTQRVHPGKLHWTLYSVGMFSIEHRNGGGGGGLAKEWSRVGEKYKF